MNFENLYSRVFVNEDDSSVSSIAVTDLKVVRRSLLQKLWNDFCLKESKYWSMQSRFIDYEWRDSLTADTIMSFDIQLFSSVLTTKEFQEKAEEIYSRIRLDLSLKWKAQKDKTVKQKSVFDFFGGDVVKTKSYDLPIPHFVVCEFYGLGHYGTSLNEAMEVHGGMSALYALKDDPEYDQAFKDLYNPRIKKIVFGDCFTIYKDELATQLQFEDDLSEAA